jgi:predicted transcriptional regulator of viral defense system
VKTEKPRLGAREYVANLAASGRYHFASGDAQSALGISAAAAKLALNRLAKHQIVASPARGFYVIVPPEYRSLGCLPADQFIPALMKRLELPYYAGLLSAAQYHGAAHHRPQQFQVMLSANRRPIHCGKVDVAFFARKNIGDIPLQEFNTPRGTIKVSTPEATAIDLVGYQHRAGGLDNVATILSELVERIDPKKLPAAAAAAPVPWAQRLGYLFDKVEAKAAAASLKSYVDQHARQTAPLLATKRYMHSNRDDVWKLYINATVEAET